MAKRKKNPSKKIKNKNITKKDILTLVIFIGIPIGWLLFMLGKTAVGLILLQTHGTKTKAVVSSMVISSIKYGHPKYLYVFQYEGKEYSGNSLIEEKDTYRVGDSIDVLFLDFWPTMNRPTYYYRQCFGK